MRRVPPPPTTKRAGSSVSKPSGPRLVPPPPQITLATQEQSSSQVETGIANEPTFEKIETEKDQTQEMQTNIGDNIREKGQQSVIQSGVGFGDGQNQKIQIEQQNLEPIESKIFQAPKIPPAIKAVKPLQGARKQVAPPKIVAKPSIALQAEQLTVPSQVQPIGGPHVDEKQIEEKETPIREESENLPKPENKEMESILQEEPTTEQVESVNQQPMQTKKTAPPQVVKKQTSSKVPPPTKKLPVPPKPVETKTEQVPLEYVQNGQKILSTHPINRESEEDKEQQKFLQEKKEQKMAKKVGVTPSIIKAPLVSPKKPQLKSPSKLEPTNPDKKIESPIEINNPRMFKVYESQLPTQQMQVQAPKQSQPSPIQNSPNAYNELQQKLRKLEMMRSRMDQSSQESYSNNNDEIEEEEEEGEHEGEEENEERPGFINIVGERNLNLEQEGEYVQCNITQKGQEYVIGETNYDEMEIKDYHEEEHLRNSATPISNPFSNQLTELSSSQNDQDSLIPAPADTIVESNISLEETQHQYLPDEVSISPVDSQNSMGRHHLIHQHYSSANNVVHADKYHSQANFSSVEGIKINLNETEEVGRNQSRDVERSDGELVRPIHDGQDDVMKRREKIRDDSLYVNRGEESYVPYRHLQTKQKKKNSLITLPSQQKNFTSSIAQLLQKFTNRKSQYEKNLEKLKKSEEAFRTQELRYQQKIEYLLQQVNHKNILLLKHSNNLFDRNKINDRLTEVEEL